jgi:hypothetical protein
MSHSTNNVGNFQHDSPLGLVAAEAWHRPIRVEIGGAFAVTAALFMLGGLVMFTRTGGVRREGSLMSRAAPPTFRVVPAAERRSVEVLAGGLLALGVLFFGLAVVIG